MIAAEALVAHQPSDHPYVRHVQGDGGVNGACRAARAPFDVWDVDGVRRAGVQIVHLHFGYEQLSTVMLEQWLASLAGAGIKLVHTVHDLHNPHLSDQRHYRRLQARIIAAADHVLTLTPTAARLIASMFGRLAQVLVHPHVVPLPEMVRRGGAAGMRVGVYVHAATLRPNLDLDVLARLAAAACAHGNLRVHVRDSAPARRRSALECTLAGTGAMIEVGPRLSDGQLWDRLAGAQLVALPYRWGTHSGLLEAAHDLGTPVLGPSFGGYGDQGATVVDGPDLAGPMRRAIDRRPIVDVGGRRTQREALSASHRHIYQRLVTV